MIDRPSTATRTKRPGTPRRANSLALSSPDATSCSRRLARGAWDGLGGRADDPRSPQGRSQAHQGRMDSRSVLARFEAECQALPLMDHPNIAKVLDGD